MKRKRLIGILLLFVFLSYFGTSIHGEPRYGNVYCRNSANTGKIALTFDDGPHPRYTQEILNILDEYQIPATFFIIGVNAELYPEDLKKIIDAGCEIGNHTYSHRRISNMSGEEFRSQIQQCESAIYSITGVRPCIFRPPEGILPEHMKSIVIENHYNIVLWSIDTMDWAMNPSDKILTAVMQNLKGGDIILMHDYVSGGNTTCEALRLIIPKILAKGYEFVTVSELINGDHATA